MNDYFISFVNQMKERFLRVKDDIHLVIMANRNNRNTSYTINRSMEAILQICEKYDIEYEYYTDENTFIKEMLDNPYTGNKRILVYNRSINGPLKARRMLIPAFCSYNNIPYLGNDSYRMGLLCNKFHYYSIMKSLGIPVAEYWCYQHNYGWISSRPPYGSKVIAKLVNENNASSLTNESVFIYSPALDTIIDELSLKYQQAVVIQKFIIGYEVTVPVFIKGQSIYVPEVIGSQIDGNKRFGNEFINETLLKERIVTNYTEKYFRFSTINTYVSENIKKDVKRIVRALGITSFTRFDLRIDDSFSYYFNDLGSMPGILPDSSYSYLFNINGLSYEDFIITTIILDNY